MPFTEDNKYYDFEELYFEKNCDIDNIIQLFFDKYRNDIIGDIDYITYKIKQVISSDRDILMQLNSDGNDLLNRIGKVSFVKHYVNPSLNNNKEYYIFAINSFI